MDISQNHQKILMEYSIFIKNIESQIIKVIMNIYLQLLTYMIIVFHQEVIMNYIDKYSQKEEEAYLIKRLPQPRSDQEEYLKMLEIKFGEEMRGNVLSVAVIRIQSLTILFHFQREVQIHIEIFNFFVSNVIVKNLQKLVKFSSLNAPLH